METHGILGFNEIEQELGLPLEITRPSELFVGLVILGGWTGWSTWCRSVTRSRAEFEHAAKGAGSRIGSYFWLTEEFLI